MNSYYHTGLKNLMDEAILDHGTLRRISRSKRIIARLMKSRLTFKRRRMSVIVEDKQNQHILICKGAVEEITSLSPTVEIEGKVLMAKPDDEAGRKQLVQELNSQGSASWRLPTRSCLPAIATSPTIQ